MTGYAPAPQALVEVDASVSCARCAEGKGCGAGLLGRTSGSRRIDALIAGGLTVGEGDDVRIELAPSNLLRASMIVYGLPLSGALLGAALAYFVGLGELYAATASIGGILAGLVLARLRLRKTSCLRQFTPTIVERLQGAD
ncbi:MAG: SoxR reducing system RseC family protein [Woeseiaceae bacterium]